MRIVIHHNPECGTSRNVVAMVEQAGFTPTVIDYRQSGWTRPQLLGLFAAAGLSAAEAMRIKGTPAEDLGLTAESVDEDAIIDAMIEHPILVNRPFVCTSRGVRLCRPSEAVLDLLPPGAIDRFVKEDGEEVLPSEG